MTRKFCATILAAVLAVFSSFAADLVWSNIDQVSSFTKIDGASGFTLSALTLPVPDGMTAGDKVVLQSVGIVFRESNYPASLTLKVGEANVSSSSRDEAVAVDGLIHHSSTGDKQGYLVRYNFIDVEVPVGEAVTLSADSIDAILVKPNTYSVVSQSRFSDYSLVYEVKATTKDVSNTPTPDFAWTPGSAPTGWFTGWKGEDNEGKPRQVVGKNGVETSYVVYDNDSNDRWHPYRDNLGQWSDFSISLYGSTDMIETPEPGQYAVILCVGQGSTWHVTLALNSERKIVLLQQSSYYLYNSIVGPEAKGYHLLTLSMASQTPKLAVDGTLYTQGTNNYWYPYFYTMAAGKMQIGSTYGGNPTGRVRADGLVVKQMLGYNKALSATEIAALAAAYPAVTSVGELDLSGESGDVYLPNLETTGGIAVGEKAQLILKPNADYTLSSVISGEGRVTVDAGAGNTVTLAAQNTFSGGLTVLTGTAKQTITGSNANRGFGPNNYSDLTHLAEIIVSEGAILDLANTKDASYFITSSGEITNSGEAISNGSRQTTKLTVADTTTVSGKQFGLLGPNWAETTLDLSGGNLIVNMESDDTYFLLVNTTIIDGGVIRLERGKLYLKKTIKGTLAIDLDEVPNVGDQIFVVDADNNLSDMALKVTVNGEALPLGVQVSSAGVVEEVNQDVIVEKDEALRTWTIDTTKAAYTLPSGDTATLKKEPWLVTLKSSSENGATINLGENSSAQASRYVIESGTHNLTWVGTVQTMNFDANGTDANPSILVKDGATLNFTARDVTGWNNSVSGTKTNVIRVNDGGTLNLLQYFNAANTGMTFFYQGHFYLEPGAAIETSYTANSVRLNGGTDEECSQIYVPAPTGENTTVTYTNSAGFRLASNATQGYAVQVEAGSTLEMIGAFSTEANSCNFAKYGKGTLVIDGSLVSFGGKIILKDGYLKLRENSGIAAGTITTIEGETRQLGSVTADGWTTYSFGDPIAAVGVVPYWDLSEAFVAASSNGGVVTIYDETIVFTDGVFKRGEEIVFDPSAKVIEVVKNEEDGTFATHLSVADFAALRISEIMPKPVDKPASTLYPASLSRYDKNGLESGWVELENTSDKWVDLADYAFTRVNRGKATKLDAGAFPSVMIAPRAKYVFYTSERYSNSASAKDSAWQHGTFDGKPKYFEEYDMMIWGDKVNPKKSPFVRLYYVKGGAETPLDTVVIPTDFPEGHSIIVEKAVEGETIKRYMTQNPTPGADNATENLTAIGPTVGPLYEISDKKKHNSANEFGEVAPAKVGEDYEIVFPLNPIMSPTAIGGFRSEDAIKSITLVYRTDLDDKTLKREIVPLEKTTDKKDRGDLYTATIPHAAFDEIGAGHLIQWKFEITTDDSGVTFTSPAFLNKDDGYEWYGTIVEPGDLNSENLPTWHMFADSVSVQQMDIDVDKQDLSKVPYNARIAIYDSTTSNYYDYVRIDLRGNTSAHFNKKSHGLRFAKAHPLTMVDIVASEGETIVKREEVRKSSLIGEPADPSYMRQMMSFWLWNKMGNKVPFDFPVRCNLNGAFYQMGFHSERFTDELIEDFHKLDKYGYGYKNVGTLKSGSSTTAGKIEKKTPDDGNESDISVLQNQFRAKIVAAQQVKSDPTGASTSGLDNSTLTKFVVEKFNLPAWLNYLASARITQEMDDVWANISIYYDNAEMKEGVRGTDTWMPLGYDFNLSLGQWYHNDVGSGYGLMSNQDWFKSHPFYGGNRVRCYKGESLSTTCNSGNDAMEAVWQNAKFRRLYLRRLRTLMDQELGAPDTTGEENETNSQIPLMKKIREISALMEKDAVLDRTKWPHDGSIGNIDVWGGDKPWPESMQAGIKEIWDDYIVPRRQHLYVTHSTHSSMNVGYGTNLAAGIPDAQSAIGMLKDGFSAEYNAEIGAVVIKNANLEAVDMSGWVLSGPVSMTLPAGTVIDQCDEATPAELYVTADRRTTIAKMNELNMITDQVVVGNGEIVETEVITLKAGDEPVIAPPEPSEQELYVKLYGFCGVPVEGDDAEGEFIVLWNTVDHEVDAAGLTISICKTGDAVAKCLVTLPEGTAIPAGSYLRLNHADYPKSVGWDKITNGDVDIKITDVKGVDIYLTSTLSQSSLGVKATGSYAKHDWETDTWSAEPIENAPGYIAPEPPPVDPVDPPAEGDITGDFDELQTFAAGTYTINGANFNGGVNIAGDVTLTLKGENTLSTMTTAGTLTIEGDGTLTINCTDGEAGSAAVTLTKPYIQNGGNVVVNLLSENQVFGFYCNTATKDALGNGIYAVELNGGTFTTTIAGGESSAAFKLGKGSNDAKLGGTDVNITLGGTAPRFINADGKIKLTKNCGKVTITTAAEGGTQANVFKSKKEIEINGGTIIATASGEGSEIFSSDLSILVKDGVLNLTAADDCLSAENHINISGGIVYAMSTAGDALDSNGDMTISGGYVFAFVTSTEHEALDIDPSEDPTAVDNDIAHKLYINEGATVVAVGGLSTVHGPDEGSTADCLVKTGLSSSSKYLVMTGIVDDENIRRTTTATINWNKKHAKTFTLIATMPGFVGEITEGGDEVKPSTGKLADEISGMFVNTVESSIVTPSGATTWADLEVTESTTIAELVGAEQAATLAKFEEVTPEVIATWAKKYSSTTKPGAPIDLVAFALNCAPTEEAITEKAKTFKVTITMTAEGPVAEIESGFYNITPVLKGKVELPEENWIEVTDDNKGTFRFFRAFIEIGD